MNILIAKTVLQSWVKNSDIALFVDDAKANYWECYDIAQEDENDEIICILEYIREVDMIHILANKY